MNSKIKKLVKEIFPPFFLNFVSRFSGYGWSGSYSSWSDALSRCSGYDSDYVIEKLKNAALKVKSGEALFERDSVLFYEKKYTNIILIGLLLSLTENNKNLNIVDFGGSFASSYFQNLLFLSNINGLSLKWNIVEQEKIVKIGKELFQNENLKFYYNIQDCLAENSSDTLVLSSVLQYIENPYYLLNVFINSNFKYIIIDRTPFIKKGGKDIICIQKANRSIYKASYPSWVFNEEKFLLHFKSYYDIILEELSPDNSNNPDIFFKGFILKLKNDKKN